MKFPSDSKIPEWADFYLKEVWQVIKRANGRYERTVPDYVDLIKKEMMKRGFDIS